MGGRPIAIAVALVVLLTSACSGGSSEPTGPTPTNEPSGPTATGEPSGPTSPTGGGPTGGTIVRQANYSFDPSMIEVKTGAKLTVQNTTATTPHTFTVEGEDLDVTLGPQTSTRLTIDLAPGEYPVICRFHEGLGMTATLRVSG